MSQPNCQAAVIQIHLCRRGAKASQSAADLLVGVLVVFSPGPVHARIGIVLGLSGDRMAVAKEKLLVGVVLEVVITANIDHGRSLRLRRGKAFAPVGKDLRAQLQPLAEFPFHQPSGIRKVSIVGLRDHW